MSMLICFNILICMLYHSFQGFVFWLKMSRCLFQSVNNQCCWNDEQIWTQSRIYLTCWLTVDTRTLYVKFVIRWTFCIFRLWLICWFSSQMTIKLLYLVISANLCINNLKYVIQYYKSKWLNSLYLTSVYIQ